jgi:hypothetical protein
MTSTYAYQGCLLELYLLCFPCILLSLPACALFSSKKGLTVKGQESNLLQSRTLSERSYLGPTA